MPETVLLHIGSPKARLSKRQKEFNQLTKKIEEMENLISDLVAGKSQLERRFYSEMQPLIAKFVQGRVDMVLAMDRVYHSEIFRKPDRHKLDQIISDMCFELITKNGREELKSIFDRHHDDDFDTVNAEIDRQAAEIAKGIAAVYGFKPDDEDSFHAGQFENRKREKERAQKPKSPKQQEREEKRKVNAQNLSKSVRAVYMDLVKALHPDREADELEKVRKTGIMQRVTKAYKENDLMQLLKLQMEFNRIDKDHLETLADEQLVYYNKILKQRVLDLEDRKLEVAEQLGSLIHENPIRINSIESVIFGFNRQLSDLKKQVKSFKNDLAFWNDATSVKMFLKTYQIRNQGY